MFVLTKVRTSIRQTCGGECRGGKKHLKLSIASFLQENIKLEGKPQIIMLKEVTGSSVLNMFSKNLTKHWT